MGKRTYAEIPNPGFKKSIVEAVKIELICPIRQCKTPMEGTGISLMSDKTFLHRCPKCKHETYTKFQYPRLSWK